jgi:hypothetical protein
MLSKLLAMGFVSMKGDKKSAGDSRVLLKPVVEMPDIVSGYEVVTGSFPFPFRSCEELAVE